MQSTRVILTWAALAAAIAVPTVAAATSPLLAWRHPVYIAAGFAGIIGLGLLFVQPLLIGGWLPALSPPKARRLHRWVGGLLVATVIMHVGGLWFTNAPDVIDALLFSSPTPFSVWGVIAMWACFAAALMAALRRRLRLRPRTWRAGHASLALIIVVGTVVHAFLIEGTMETVSKLALSALSLMATMKVIASLMPWPKPNRRTE